MATKKTTKQKITETIVTQLQEEKKTTPQEVVITPQESKFFDTPREEVVDSETNRINLGLSDIL